MVQKEDAGALEAPRKRGRPRAYEPDVALTRAMEAFWKNGYAATSLDDLSVATGMNRPSLYAAFGDKKALFRAAYAQYVRASREAMGDLFTRACSLRQRLRLLFSRATDLYQSGDGTRGCFSVMTAASDTIGDTDIRALVTTSIDGLDRTFLTMFTNGVADGELPDTADVAQLALLATATLHTLSVRARAGVPRKALDTLIDAAVATLLPPRSTTGAPAARRDARAATARSSK